MAQTQDPWITSQTLYHCAMQDPTKIFCCVVQTPVTRINTDTKLNLIPSPLPNVKIWALTKLKAFADDKFNDAKMLISLFL